MKRTIRTYDDLLKEKNQLEVLLKAQKELIRQDIAELKVHLQPAVNAVSFVGKLFTRDNNNLLITGGINFLTDVLFRKIIFSKAGWITQLVVPFFIKNYSSHFVADHKEGLLKKLFSLFRHKHSSNGHATADMSRSENN